ncbi:rna-directed dna polymerase from mobile element jockey-like [Willisornis vidua]|uniref:Rna-directed dna polymerase from mobile element jockey-like n=1 Tax=Willisornis vidua TaxID=1566151 RepID=A0ABQ9D8E6_9PASS|nr:rna-directed dna polymerase from mobile element jockey-like [Willisornis vidua]
MGQVLSESQTSPANPEKDELLCFYPNLAMQSHLDRLERGVHVNLMKFNKVKCKILHLGQDNPKHRYKVGREWIDSSSGKKDLGILDETLYMTWQWALAAQKVNCVLGCIPSRAGSSSSQFYRDCRSGYTAITTAIIYEGTMFGQIYHQHHL